MRMPGRHTFFCQTGCLRKLHIKPFLFFYEPIWGSYASLSSTDSLFSFHVDYQKKKILMIALFFLPNIVIQLYSWENFMSFYFILLVVENWKTAEIAHKSPTTEITLFILTLAQQYSLVIRTTKRGQKAMYRKNAWRYHLLKWRFAYWQ